MPFGAIYCDWYPLLQNYSGEEQWGMMWIMIMMALVMLIYTRALEAGHNHRWLQKKKKKEKKWPEQSGGLAAATWKEQNAVAEGSVCMRGLCMVSTSGKKACKSSGFLCMLWGCTFFDFNEPLTPLLNSYLMSPETVLCSAGFHTCRALKQHIRSEAESWIIWPGCRMPFCKWQRKSALENTPLPSLLFIWLQRLPLLGCRLQVQQHAKQPTLCFCQGTRLPTTENSQGPTGAVAKHKGNLVSKVNSTLFQVCLKFSAPPVPLLLDTVLVLQKALSNRHKDARPSLSQQTMPFIKWGCCGMLLEHISVMILRNWVKVSLPPAISQFEIWCILESH